MKDIQLIRTQTGFIPANETDDEKIKPIKIGSLCIADIVRPRNEAFHRKFFSMLNFAYQMWEPAQVKWKEETAVKNFERFREDILILAGHYETVVNIRGEARVQAKSIAFASMDDLEFNQIYKAVFDVIWRKVFSDKQGYTQEKLENTLMELLSYD